MWKCHKCGKPVYFAERKQSLGYDWHPECLRCEECSKRLNPGQHAEHKGVPYCHVPCYGALFGPQLFGHGTRVESHTSFGKVENRSGTPNLPRTALENKLKTFNQYYEGKSGKVHCREVNGRLVLEGALRIYWGVVGVIHLKEEYDQRTVVTVRKRNSYLFSNGNTSEDSNSTDGKQSVSPESPLSPNCPQPPQPPKPSECQPGQQSPEKVVPANNTEETQTSQSPEARLTPTSSEILPESLSNTLPAKLDDPNLNWDELDDFLQVERKLKISENMYQTMPSALPSSSEASSSLTSEACKSSDNVGSSSNESNLNGGATPRSRSADNSPVLTVNRNSPDDSPDLSVSSEDSYSKNFEENVESEKRMMRSQSMPPDCSGDDFWADESLGDDDDDDDLSVRQLDRSVSVPESVNSSASSGIGDSVADDGEVPRVRRKAAKTGSAAIRRRSGRRRSRTKLRRRCSINGHFYDRDTSFFTPPNGSSTSVWVTSLVSTQEVVNLILDKYRVDSTPDSFALFVVYDNGEQRRMREDEYPLLTRVMLGPHEDVARIQIVDRHSTCEVSNEVAQFINLSLAECSAILERYHEEERRQIANIQAKYKEMRKRIKQRMDELKVRL